MDYTKGKWMLHSLVYGEEVHWEIHTQNGKVLAAIGGGDAEAKANARLIAEAPALVEALKALLEGQVLYGDRVVDRQAPSSESILKGFEVLAKVEGKESK